MTRRANVKTEDFDKYRKMRISEIEEEVEKLRALPQTPETRRQFRAATQAIRQRQRELKQAALEFEKGNNHHLLVTDSTNGFSKIVGNSVLFYAMSIAQRLHRRYKVQPDTDSYAKSAEGVISIRSVERLEEQLAMVDIVLDEERSTLEMHFFKLPKVYTEQQIEELRDRSKKEMERIMEIIIPESPLPLLYRQILELNRLVYHNCKNMSERLARETLGQALVLQANALLESYLNFAGMRTRATLSQRELQNAVAAVERKAPSRVNRAATQHLFTILVHAQQLKNHMANMENLKLMHHKQVALILEAVVEIMRTTEREYSKRVREAMQEKTDEKEKEKDGEK